MRVLVGDLEARFVDLTDRIMRLSEEISFEDLFSSALGREEADPGMHLVKSAASIEQCFGGITTRLWDDPHEWTLKESFQNAENVADYFSEVEKARENGFAHLVSDEDLKKQIPTPAGMSTIFAVLLDALAKAEIYLSMANDLISRNGLVSRPRK